MSMCMCCPAHSLPRCLNLVAVSQDGTELLKSTPECYTTFDQHVYRAAAHSGELQVCDKQWEQWAVQVRGRTCCRELRGTSAMRFSHPEESTNTVSKCFLKAASGGGGGKGGSSLAPLPSSLPSPSTSLLWPPPSESDPPASGAFPVGEAAAE